MDVKPARLLLCDARSTRIRQSTRSNEFSGAVQPFQMGSQNFIPIPFIFPPTWPQYQLQPPPSTVAPMTTHPSHSPPQTHVESLDIEPWFQALESNPVCNRKGLEFGKFGRMLVQNSFDRITQLSCDIIHLRDLQDWLGIDAGTAAFIIEHAQEDVRWFKELGGQLY